MVENSARLLSVSGARAMKSRQSGISSPRLGLRIGGTAEHHARVGSDAGGR